MSIATGIATETLDHLRMWKRNGEYGVYVVEVISDERAGKVKIRLRYHMWVRTFIDGKYADRWVLARRLRPLEPHERERLARDGWPA